MNDILDNEQNHFFERLKKSNEMCRSQPMNEQKKPNAAISNRASNTRLTSLIYCIYPASYLPCRFNSLDKAGKAYQPAQKKTT